jgi:hypothetical protein
MTYSSDRVLQHIETQAYNVLDTYFNNVVNINPQVGGGGGELRGGVREHALFIDKQFSDIMAGGGCDNPIIANPNSAFLPPLKAPMGNPETLDTNMPDYSPIVRIEETNWPFSTLQR